MTVKLYLDTEFNGFRGELISMALVQSESEFWYTSLPLPKRVHPWVKANVVPLLDTPPVKNLQFQPSLWRWLSHYHNPTIVCDWYEDAIHFLNLFAGVDYGSSRLYPCKIELITTGRDGPVSEKPHHALYDAMALMRWCKAKEIKE